MPPIGDPMSLQYNLQRIRTELEVPVKLTPKFPALLCLLFHLHLVGCGSSGSDGLSFSLSQTSYNFGITLTGTGRWRGGLRWWGWGSRKRKLQKRLSFSGKVD